MNRRNLGLAIARLIPQIIRGAHLELFRKSSVTQTQFCILIAVHVAKSATMSDVARNLKVRMPTATGIVARLVRMGFLRRNSENEDRRQVRVELTPKGLGFVRKFQEAVSRRWTEVLSALDDRELGPFYRGIMKLQKQFEAEA